MRDSQASRFLGWLKYFLLLGFWGNSGILGDGTDSKVAVAYIYSLTGPATEQFRAVRGSYYNAKTPPASTLLVFEGLPSNDATIGVDLVAIPR